jgi:hypothetical protein
LFESLVKEADAATRQIRTKTEHAQALAAALAEQQAGDGGVGPARKAEGTFPMMRSKI